MTRIDPDVERAYGKEAALADELFQRAVDATGSAGLSELLSEANELVGNRSPLLEGGAFFVYGYLKGRLDR